MKEKVNHNYCLKCEMPRLHLDKSCLNCNPELIKSVHKRQNLAVLKGLAIYYLITYLLISTIGFWLFKPLIIKYFYSQGIDFIKNGVSIFLFIGVVYLFTLLIDVLVPLIIRFIVYKKPISSIKTYLWSAINLIFLVGILFSLGVKPVIAGCATTFFISNAILSYGYDKRLDYTAGEDKSGK